MWYRQGTVTVTNGSNVVTGAGTDFVSNAQIGDAFVGPDMRSYEIGQIISATDLRLATNYQAASGGGQAYAIQPTQSYIRDLALQAGLLLNTFAVVRDGVGQGLFGDGSAALPGIRFTADQDTGICRTDNNGLGIVTGGVVRLVADAAGAINFANGTVNGVTARLTTTFGGGSWRLQVTNGENGNEDGTVKARLSLMFNDANENAAIHFLRGVDGVGGHIAMKTSGVERARLTSGGSFLVGVVNSVAHHIAKLAGQGEEILRISNAAYGFTTAVFCSVGSTNLGSAAEAAVKVGTNPSTGRSLNAGGTINASGADYAEYMLKAEGCGTIAKGDVCGVDRVGLLTDRWADAISFMVKSTNPSLVGGDIWAAHLPARPEPAGAEPQPPMLPAVPADDADDAVIAAYRDELAAYPLQIAQYQTDHAAWLDATAAYQHDLPAWEDTLEAARVRVDRIAYCGQVPVNMSGAVDVGDYLVAVQDGDGIAVVAVADAAITFDQYRRRVGKVLAIRDGRPWVNVQHG
jgi:hypothetical protein